MLQETALDTSTYTGALRKVIKGRIGRTALTVRQISERSGLHPDYLGHCLRGTRPMTTTLLCQIATTLDTTAGQLHKEARALCD